MHHSESLLREYIDAPVSVLAVTDQEAELFALKAITSNTRWRFHAAQRVSAAIEAITTHNIGVVITGRELPDGTWIDILECLRARRNAPRLIVYSPTADTQFWADVLSVGGYDVLATPFDREEVLRAGYIGWLSWSRASRITPVTDRTNATFGTPVGLGKSARVG